MGNRLDLIVSFGNEDNLTEDEVVCKIMEVLHDDKSYTLISPFAQENRAFIELLDKEIEEADKLVYEQTLRYEPDGSYEARSNALYEAKQKFLTLTPPPIK